MKLLIPALLLFSQLAQAQNIFWCTPNNRLNKLEAVIVRIEDGKNVFATYTTSRKWGAVDEKTQSFKFENEAGNWVYRTADASLAIEVGDRTPHREDIFSGVYRLENQGAEVVMDCEFNQ